jgi:hypothetical protein
LFTHDGTSLHPFDCELPHGIDILHLFDCGFKIGGVPLRSETSLTEIILPLQIAGSFIGEDR